MLTKTKPSTMLGLRAEDLRREQQTAARPVRFTRIKRAGRLALTVLALVFALLSFGGGAAQAWPWDDLKDNLTSTIMNFCEPNNIRDPKTYHGIDSILGLNDVTDLEMRKTVVPNFGPDGDGTGTGNGMNRLQNIYGDDAGIIAAPTYERYGFSAMTWTQYGANCFSSSTLVAPFANTALDIFVKVPMMLAMGALNLAMDNVLYDLFAAMISPFINVMYDIFNPWIYLAVPVGVFIAWVISRGSLQKTAQAGAWGAFVLALFLLMSNSTSSVVSAAANLVTGISGTAACKMADAANGAVTDCTTGDGTTKSINQALWYGIPYQTWLLGQVGEVQADLDRDAEADGRVGWGAAIMNGNYVGVTETGGSGSDDGRVVVDEKGKEVLAAVSNWNRANYNPDSDASKVVQWTGGSAWAKIPFLANVKVMCNDSSARDVENKDMGAHNRWMYSGGTTEDGQNYYCDAAGAGTSEMLPYFQGTEYNKQFLVAAAGGVGVVAVGLTVAGSSIYLSFQKMMFFFLLFLGAPIILISAFGDQKRRSFLVRYAELIGANLLKQVIAVCVVLFVSYSMTALMYPKPDSAWFDIPWLVKPYAAQLFFLALVFLAFPLKNLMKGAVKGDTSVVDKAATAPQRAAKTAAKAAVVTAAVVATGGAAAALGAGAGTGLLAGGKVAALGKAGTFANQAGRLLGHGSKAGKALRASGKLMKMGEGVLSSQDAQQGKKAALQASANALLNGPEGQKYRGADGQLLPNAQQMAMKDAQRMSVTGEKASKAAKAQDAEMSKFFSGYKATTGEFHQNDPQSPENLLAAKIAKEREREAIKRAATAKAPAPGDATGAPTFVPSSPTGDAGTAAPDYSAAREQWTTQARENLGGPAFSRGAEYSRGTPISGDDVLSAASISKEDVLANPTVLLSGNAYNGGSTTAMDPFHPATSALNDLRFATVGGDESAIERAVARAVDAIQANGVPDQVSGVHSIGSRAENFDPIQVVGAMPTLTPESAWNERAEAAHTMMGASVAVPADFAGREAVQAYTDALANPAVEIGLVESLKMDAITAIQSTLGASASNDFATAAAAATGVAAGAAASDLPADSHAQPPRDASSAPGLSREDIQAAVAQGVREASDFGGSPSSEAPLAAPTVVASGGDDAPSTPKPAPREPSEPVAEDEEQATFRPRRRGRRAFGFLGDEPPMDEPPIPDPEGDR